MQVIRLSSIELFVLVLSDARAFRSYKHCPTALLPGSSLLRLEQKKSFLLRGLFPAFIRSTPQIISVLRPPRSESVFRTLFPRIHFVAQLREVHRSFRPQGPSYSCLEEFELLWSTSTHSCLSLRIAVKWNWLDRGDVSTTKTRKHFTYKCMSCFSSIWLTTAFNIWPSFFIRNPG